MSAGVARPNCEFLDTLGSVGQSDILCLIRRRPLAPCLEVVFGDLIDLLPGYPLR
jgi:hypothetical protein